LYRIPSKSFKNSSRLGPLRISVKLSMDLSGPCSNFSRFLTSGGNKGVNNFASAPSKGGRFSSSVGPERDGYKSFALVELADRACRKEESPKSDTPFKSFTVTT
jgi:hypothetical protein